MRKITLLLLVTIAIPVMAQDGYLVTMKGDTVRGKIQIQSYDLMDRVAFRVDGKKKNLPALEVRTIVLDSIKYLPVQYENKIRFMQVMKSGYLSLYAFRLDNPNSYDGRLLVKMNGSKLEVPNIQFKKLMSDFLEDCAPASEKVDSGELGRSKIEEIVDTYNECIKKQNEKTVIAAANASPLTEAIYALRVKVEASSLDSKKDVLDLLTGMDTKARLKEPVPGYLKDGLKSYLADKKEFEAEYQKVMELLP